MTEEQIIKLAVEKGVEAADKRFEALKRKFASDNKDKRLHNTKLLICNYRMFKAHAEKSVYSATECEDSVFDILAMMSDSDFSKAETTVKSIKNSAARTAIMVNHIDSMLEVYKIICKKSGVPENKRRYRILMAIYIDDEPKSVDEIAEKESIDRSTVYRDIKKAVQVLSNLIFGIDGLT